MRRALIITSAFLTLAACGFATAAEVAADFAGRPDNALEARFFADAADGRLDEFSPLGAALVAGGVDDADELRRYEQKAESLANELRQSLDDDSSRREQVETIFEFMHRRVLRGGYDLAVTDLRVMLDQGRFNCVSATVLFNFFCGELGLECRGLEMPSHAMSRVLLADGPIDVETTCPRWFHLAGDLPRQTAAVSKTIGAAAWDDRSKAREVSPSQLAAMVYYNRGVDLLTEKRFAEAAAANAKALRLDRSNAVARSNLLATINNWSIELGNDGYYAEAISLLRQGLAMDRRFEPFGQNYVHVHHQWVEHLCGKGHFDQALAILARAKAEMPDREYLRRAETDVHRRRATAVASTPQSGPLLEWPCKSEKNRID